MAARKLMKRTVIVATSVACLASLAFVLAPAADAGRHHPKPKPKPKIEHKVFVLTFEGSETLNYHAVDADGSFGHYPGCNYTQDGDTTVHWHAEWNVPAKVTGSGADAKVDIKQKDIKLVKGPESEHPGTSTIHGETSNIGNSQSCGKRAGAYNCTARVTPTKVQPVGAVDRGPDVRFTFSPYGAIKGSYSGQAPSGLPCSAIGSDLLPGGFVAEGFPDAAATHQLVFKTVFLFRHVGETVTHKLLDDDPAWEFELPKIGDSCALANDTGATCAFVGSTRDATFKFTRIK